MASHRLLKQTKSGDGDIPHLPQTRLSDTNIQKKVNSSMNAKMYTTIIVSDPPTSDQLFKLGWNAFCDGLSLDGLKTEDEKRGWLAASRRR